MVSFVFFGCRQAKNAIITLIKARTPPVTPAPMPIFSSLVRPEGEGTWSGLLEAPEPVTLEGPGLGASEVLAFGVLEGLGLKALSRLPPVVCGESSCCPLKFSFTSASWLLVCCAGGAAVVFVFVGVGGGVVVVVVSGVNADEAERGPGEETGFDTKEAEVCKLNTEHQTWLSNSPGGVEWSQS